jgi:hypothetical protein
MNILWRSRHAVGVKGSNSTVKADETEVGTIIKG